MKKAIFFIPLFLVFLCTLCLAADDVVQLKLSMDKSVYRPGDPVIVTVSVENVYSERLKIVVIPHAFSNVFDSEHKRCKDVALTLQMEMPDKTDAVLSPGQTKVFEFKGSLKIGKASSYSNKKDSGIIWEPGIWGHRYLLRGPGKYYFDFYISAGRGTDVMTEMRVPPAKGSFEVVNE